jgi:hypothetical protein
MHKLYMRVTQTETTNFDDNGPTFEPVQIHFKELQQIEGGSAGGSHRIPSPTIAVRQRSGTRRGRNHHRGQHPNLRSNLSTLGSAFTNGTARSFRIRKETDARRRRIPAGVMMAKPSPAPSVTLMVTYDKLKSIGDTQLLRRTASAAGRPNSSVPKPLIGGEFRDSRSGTVSNRPTSALTVVQQQQQRLWHSIQSQQNQQLLLMQHIQQQQRANNARAATMAAQSLVSSLPLKPPSPPSHGQGQSTAAEQPGARNGCIVSQRVILPAIAAEQQQLRQEKQQPRRQR